MKTIFAWSKKLWSMAWKTDDYWITRFFMLRLLGLVYAVAFLILVNQGLPLIGEQGLLPASDYISRIFETSSGTWEALSKKPTIFLFGFSDLLFQSLAWVGLILSLLLLFGFDNALILFVLWALYLSFVHVGQVWYGYGWESQLLETGFLAIFLTSWLDPRPFSGTAPPVPVIWLFRWLTFRIMLGSGLIKLRGNSCWYDLTCLQYHFETQPLPNLFSRYFHYLPDLFLQSGVFFNHLAEIAAPFAVFGPGLLRIISGGIMALFQVVLILSGNLSFLNWLTLIPILACFSDREFRYVTPEFLMNYANEMKQTINELSIQRKILISGLVVLVAWLSVNPVRNFFRENQVMNASFSPLKIVNTYGAFGSVGKIRRELVVKGTQDLVIDNNTRWKAYEFKAKPGDPFSRSPIISPYHYRLDWQIWFAAMSTPRRTPWVFNFVHELLQNNQSVTGLLQRNPFPDEGPNFVKIDLYRYEYAPIGNDSKRIWKRRKIDNWLPPLSSRNKKFRKILKARNWLDD